MIVQQSKNENKNNRQVSVEDTFLEDTSAINVICCVTKFPIKCKYKGLLTAPL